MQTTHFTKAVKTLGRWLGNGPVIHYDPEPPPFDRRAPNNGQAPSDQRDAYAVLRTAPPMTSQAKLIAKYQEIGRTVARETRALKIDPAVLKALEEQAMSFAMAEMVPAYDTGIYEIDRRTEAKLAALDAQLPDAEYAVEMAEAELRRRKEEFAKLGPLAGFPAADPALKWTASLGITLSLSPTVHDLLPGLPPSLRWLIAIAFGFAFALFLVNAALPEESEETEKETAI